ncbi:hypothetical protein [Corallococcus macrosporus]|uniref:Uncharacterized protein n=1 Tax=Corallococcus macrosporus DSM 14697 TaxID=1189310 RepID=A0A250K578_9BACT|nr:hypothetical protein [Corallococcus macrosporus]ATB50842.1 hypothetical protein MYMAC_006499 [Corallococcus macrosporus DSM 14697]
MNFHDEPSPFLWWESSLWWVLALAVSAGLGAGYRLLWGPRQPGDVLRPEPTHGVGRLPQALEAVAWGVMSLSVVGPMVFIASWLVAKDSLVSHCEVMEGRPSSSFVLPLHWLGLALVTVVGGKAYLRRSRQGPRDARDVLCLPGGGSNDEPV